MKAYEVEIVTDDGGPEHRIYRETQLWGREPTEEERLEIGRVSNGRGGRAIWWAERWTARWVTGEQEAQLRRGERPVVAHASIVRA